jgi:6-phosphofructokinase 1
VLATRFGAAAAELVQKGRFGRMVALRTPDIVDVTIAEALTKPRRVDPESQPVQTARSLGVCFGDA